MPAPIRSTKYRSKASCDRQRRRGHRATAQQRNAAVASAGAAGAGLSQYADALEPRRARQRPPPPPPHPPSSPRLAVPPPWLLVLLLIARQWLACPHVCARKPRFCRRPTPSRSRRRTTTGGGAKAYCSPRRAAAKTTFIRRALAAMSGYRWGPQRREPELSASTWLSHPSPPSSDWTTRMLAQARQPPSDSTSSASSPLRFMSWEWEWIATTVANGLGARVDESRSEPRSAHRGHRACAHEVRIFSYSLRGLC